MRADQPELAPCEPVAPGAATAPRFTPAAPSERLLFIALPPAQVRERIRCVVDALRLSDRLGARMFAPGNWHQTLSSRFPDTPEVLEGLRRAGDRIAAVQVPMTLNRIRSDKVDGPLHWTLKAQGTPPGFDALLAAVRKALVAEGIDDAQGHRPHITLSYDAPEPLSTVSIGSIAWAIDEVLLVRRGGTPYRYEALARWPLQLPAGTVLHQMPLW